MAAKQSANAQVMTRMPGAMRRQASELPTEDRGEGEEHGDRESGARKKSQYRAAGAHRVEVQRAHRPHQRVHAPCGVGRLAEAAGARRKRTAGPPQFDTAVKPSCRLQWRRQCTRRGTFAAVIRPYTTMVDSRESMELHRIEQKIDGLSETVGKLSARVDTLSATVDTRFDEITQAFCPAAQIVHRIRVRDPSKRAAGGHGRDEGRTASRHEQRFRPSRSEVDRVIDSLARTPSPRRRRRS